MPSKTIIAILCLTIIEVTALLSGTNGTLLALAFIAISGLGGFALGKGRKS